MTGATETRAVEPRPAATLDAPPSNIAEGLVTVLVPVTGDPVDLDTLYREYSAPFRESGTSFEFIFIAEPSCSMRISQLEKLVEAGEPVRGVVAQTLSEATLLRVGAAAAHGERIITLPAYHRIEAPALLRLLDRRLEDGIRAVRLDVPLSDGKTLAWIYAHGEVLGRRDDSDQAHLSVRLSEADLGRLRHRQRLH